MSRFRQAATKGMVSTLFESKDSSKFEVPETQWLLLADPEVVRKLGYMRTREELLELAERMETANMQDFHLQEKALASIGEYLDQARAL